MSSPRSLTSRVVVHGLSLRKETFCKKNDGRRKLLEDWYGCHLVVCAQDRVGGPSVPFPSQPLQPRELHRRILMQCFSSPMPSNVGILGEWGKSVIMQHLIRAGAGEGSRGWKSSDTCTPSCSTLRTPEKLSDTSEQQSLTEILR